MRRSIPSDCPCPWQCSLISSYIIWYHLISSDHISTFWGWNHQKYLITSTICGIWMYMMVYVISGLRRPSNKFTWSPTSPLRSKVEPRWRALAVFAASPLFVCAQIQGHPLLGWRDGQRWIEAWIWNVLNQLGLETPSLSKLSIRSYLADLWISMDLRYIREAFEQIKIIKGYGSSKAMTSLHFTTIYYIYLYIYISQSISFIPRPDKFAMVLHLKRP